MNRMVTAISVLGMAGFLALGIAAMARAENDPPTELYVRTVPSGAKVTIDDKEVGASDGLFRVEPGKRTVQVELDGYKSVKRKVTVRAARIERVVFNLQKSSNGERSRGKSRSRSVVIRGGGGELTAEKIVISSGNRVMVKPRSVFLPDCDTKGADVVLDLASGELLPVPADKSDETAVTMFTKLGKGDMAFDRVLICLRGAKAMRHDGEHFIDMLPEDRKADATAYKLPEVPCRLLITTAEKKHFDVKILSITDAGGINFEYRPADPAIVPGGEPVEDAMMGPPMARPRVAGQVPQGAPSGALPATMDESAPGELGPVIEEILPEKDREGEGSKKPRTAGLLDLDTGRLVCPFQFGDDEREIFRRIRMEKLDAMGDINKKFQAFVILFDVAAIPVADGQWDSITAAQIKKHRALKQMDSPKTFTLPEVQEGQPTRSTCIFRTREGGLGVLQIVGPVYHPVDGVKIRYRLVKKEPNRAKTSRTLPSRD